MSDRPDSQAQSITPGLSLLDCHSLHYARQDYLSDVPPLASCLVACPRHFCQYSTSCVPHRLAYILGPCHLPSRAVDTSGHIDWSVLPVASGHLDPALSNIYPLYNVLPLLDNGLAIPLQSLQPQMEAKSSTMVSAQPTCMRLGNRKFRIVQILR